MWSELMFPEKSKSFKIQNEYEEEIVINILRGKRKKKYMQAQ